MKNGVGGVNRTIEHFVKSIQINMKLYGALKIVIPLKVGRDLVDQWIWRLATSLEFSGLDSRNIVKSRSSQHVENQYLG